MTEVLKWIAELAELAALDVMFGDVMLKSLLSMESI